MPPDAALDARRFTLAARALDSAAVVCAVRRALRERARETASVALVLRGRRTLRTARRVGLYAGSFNPLTRAHIAVAEAARREARLDALVWSCAVASVDKERVRRASLADRLVQLSALLTSQAAAPLVVTPQGLYVDQADTVRALLPPDADLYTVVGFDKVVQIFDPRYYTDREAALQQLFARTRLLVAPRGMSSEPELMELLRRPENAPYRQHVTYLPLAATVRAESSSGVRSAVEHAAPLRRWAGEVPPEARALIEVTGAFEASSASVGERDRYATRAAWLTALEDLTPGDRWTAPRLSVLVRASEGDGVAVSEVARWLAGRADSPATRVFREQITRAGLFPER